MQASPAEPIVDSSTPHPKPLMRGWLHAGMTPFMLLAGLVLVAIAPTFPQRIACAVYVLSSLCLFSNSAVYHRGKWARSVLDVLRRIDHANIFVFIAGTYTPLATVLLDGKDRVSLLVIVWAIVVVGVIFQVFWLNAPRALSTALYIAMGWVAIFWIPEFWHAGGPAVVILLAVGGIAYTVGAIIYACKAPDPSPKYFGFHEVFHACTVAAALAHLAAIVIAVVQN